MSPVTLPAGVNPYLDAEIRKMAEVLAREQHRIYWAALDDVAPKLGGRGLRQVVDAHDTLLRDLSRPASRDALARWLAAHHGLVVGATAPGWRLEGDENGPCWCLDGGGDDWINFADTAGAVGPRRVPGISALTAPVEALRAACLAAAGRTA